MSDKKHIDRLFQEKFKDFEVAPNDAVWERIEAQLKEKKKRRVVPIWWRYAGVAAILLLFISIGYNYSNNKTPIENTPNQVVDTDETNFPNQIKQGTINGSQNSINVNVVTDNMTSEADEKKSDDSITTHKNGLNQSNSSSIAKNPTKNDPAVESINKSNAILQSEDNRGNPVELAKTSEENTNKSPETQTPTIDKTKIDTQFNRNKNNIEAPIADAKINSEEAKSQNEQHKLTIEEAIEIAKNKDDETKKEDLNRWSVAPNAAPVFFNSLGKGSSIDPQFNNNSKSSETNMSYGVSASYAVNKRVSVRSGINKVNLGYNTNNVVAFQTMGSYSSMSVLQNVKPVLNSASLSAPGNDFSILSSENFANKSSQNFATTSGINTSINQSLSFIEIPLEIKYLLSDKKLGINIIGGFSSFFLNDNELNSNFGEEKIFIGEANNINKTSYSANFGFGLDYKVSKKINLNLEPMFKYQINTFNNTSGDFKPYFIGVYTGFGFKF